MHVSNSATTMKHNWEYKPFDKILKTITPISKIEKSEYQTNGLYPIVSQEDIFISGFWNNGDDITPHSSPVVIFGDHSRVLKYIDFEFVVGADGVKIIQPTSELNAKFLYHFLKWYNVPSLGYSRHFKLLKEINYPIPPMETQEQIVAELDQINNLIAKNRELLSQLDALAQSLFYDTFGDPISNPKGWSIKKLSSVSKLINGRAYKQNELLDNGKYRVIRVGNFFTNSDYYYSNLELPAEKYIDDGDLIFAWSASFGAFIWRAEKVIYHYHIWKILFDEKTLNKIFYKFLLNEMTSSFMKDLHGIGMMHLTKAGMEQYSLPIPPLALQEDFAAKVEAIEAQKAKVEAEIAELQTLLDARMDYWFN